MRTRKVLVMFAALFCVGVLVAGCGSDSDSTTGGTAAEGGGDSGAPVNIGMFMVATANTHQQAALKGQRVVVDQSLNERRLLTREIIPGESRIQRRRGADVKT